MGWQFFQNIEQSAVCALARGILKVYFVRCPISRLSKFVELPEKVPGEMAAATQTTKERSEIIIL